MQNTVATQMNDIARLSKRAVEYLFDRPVRNEDASLIWCLGRSYDSRYQKPRTPTATVTGTSPSSKSESEASHADSAVVTDPVKVSSPDPSEHPSTPPTDDELVKSFHQVQLSQSMDEDDMGWPAEFLEDFESRIWLTYRSGFAPIPRSTDAANISFATRMRNLGNQGGFTSDTGWGCMIRSGQSLLANTICILKLGRDWRVGQKAAEHEEILSLFADTPEAPFSIHRFVEHGAEACGTHPGEWFGPNATARSIRALTDKYSTLGLRVYARPNDGDVYLDSLLATATLKDASDAFQPTLIVLGIRLGIERITPAYHAALQATLELPHSVGIAGGRPSSSHYFLGHQGSQFFYLDPHTTRPMLPPQPGVADIASCHTRRLRRLALAEMDPSMLLGFLIRSRDDLDVWCQAVRELPGKPIVHVHAAAEPRYATAAERPDAVDDVETLDDDSGDEDGDGEAVGADDDEAEKL